MAKKRRQAKIPTLAWERPRGTIGQQLLGRGFQFYGAVVIGVLMAAGVGVIGYAFLADELEERRRPGSTALQVEDSRFRLDYFSDRLLMYVANNGGPGVVDRVVALAAVSDLLVREEVARRFADELDVTASDEEIQEGIAARLGISVDDGTFAVAFQQELARSGLPEEDYRLMVRASVLEDKLREHFQEEAPESAESARYRQILVSEQATADDIKQQIEDGADFAKLAAKDSNLDAANRESGGEVGWVPRGLLENAFEEEVFALKPGDLATVPSASPQGVFIIEMLEKKKDRKIEEEALPELAASALEDWIQEKRETLSIVASVVPGAENYDQEKAEWAVDRAYAQQPQVPVPVQ